MTLLYLGVAVVLALLVAGAKLADPSGSRARLLSTDAMLWRTGGGGFSQRRLMTLLLGGAAVTLAYYLLARNRK